MITSILIGAATTVVGAGALALCRWIYKRHKDKANAEKILEEQAKENRTVVLIRKEIEPLQAEILELQETYMELADVEDDTKMTVRHSWGYRIIQLCRRYIAKGYILHEQYDQLSEMYKHYTHFGGNGQAKGYFDKATSLPMYPTDEAAAEAYEKKGTY